MSPTTPRSRISNQLKRLQRECRACTRCVEDGTLPEANPTFEGRPDAIFFLIGQAPGPVEREARRPFMGRAGQELARWMARAGFASDDEFRRWTYVAALVRCFPGRNATNTGDRPPPPRAIANCAPWLEAELKLVQPRVLILVGQLAISVFWGRAHWRTGSGGPLARAP